MSRRSSRGRAPSSSGLEIGDGDQGDGIALDLHPAQAGRHALGGLGDLVEELFEGSGTSPARAPRIRTASVLGSSASCTSSVRLTTDVQLSADEATRELQLAGRERNARILDFGGNSWGNFSGKSAASQPLICSSVNTALQWPASCACCAVPGHCVPVPGRLPVGLRSESPRLRRRKPERVQGVSNQASTRPTIATPTKAASRRVRHRLRLLGIAVVDPYSGRQSDESQQGVALLAGTQHGHAFARPGRRPSVDRPGPCAAGC